MRAEDGALQTQPAMQKAQNPQNGEIGHGNVEEDLVAGVVLAHDGVQAGQVEELRDIQYCSWGRLEGIHNNIFNID
jgi:hypothetical protein